MKITRRQLRKLIIEARHSSDDKSILESFATISYFYGYVTKLLIHARTSYPNVYPSVGFALDDIQINLSGILDETSILNAHSLVRVSKITGRSRESLYNESFSLRQEAQDHAYLKISESYGDAYAHLLKLAYDGNSVLGMMAYVDAVHIINPEIQVEWRFDDIESFLQDDDYLLAMDSIT